MKANRLHPCTIQAVREILDEHGISYETRHSHRIKGRSCIRVIRTGCDSLKMPDDGLIGIYECIDALRPFHWIMYTKNEHDTEIYFEPVYPLNMHSDCDWRPSEAIPEDF